MNKILFYFCISLLLLGKEHEMTGIASWYGHEPFLGNRTPSGIICDGRTPQVAHKTLPFGIILKVTNINTNRWAKVIVTDRGPYIKGRIIDFQAKWLMNGLCGKPCGLFPAKLEIIDTTYACTKYRCLSKYFGKELEVEEIKKLGLTWIE